MGRGRERGGTRTGHGQDTGGILAGHGRDTCGTRTGYWWDTDGTGRDTGGTRAGHGHDVRAPDTVAHLDTAAAEVTTAHESTTRTSHFKNTRVTEPIILSMRLE